jgi:hypothetical protein
MPRVIERTIYTFDELSDKAKARARDWWREGGLDYDWWDSTYDDFLQICAILGVTIKTRSYQVSGKNGPITRSSPCIEFTGFCQQGDGACFEGTYEYKAKCAREIRRYAGRDEKLWNIADRLVAVQKKYRYDAAATIEHTGRYSHAYSTTINVYLANAGFRRADDLLFPEDETEIKEIMHDLMNWLYRQLESEYEYLLSDEAVDESIEANEYTFDENGNREG